MSNDTKQNLLAYLPVVTALVIIAVAWGSYSERISAAEEITKVQGTRIEILERILTDLRLDTATIKVDVAYIKSRI